MVSKEEFLDEKEKKKIPTILKIIVLILLIILVCLTFIWARKTDHIPFINNKSSQVSTEPEIEVEIYNQKETDESPLIEDLINGGDNNALINEFAKDKKVNAKDISNYRAYYIAENNKFYRPTKPISLEEYTKEVKKQLGRDYIFKPETINFNESCHLYNYDKEKQIFIKQYSNCDDDSKKLYFYKPIKETRKGKILEIDIRVLFLDENTNNIYSDYDKKYIVGEYKGKYPYNLGTMYRFTFEEQDGYYTFLSSEPLVK